MAANHAASQQGSSPAAASEPSDLATWRSVLSLVESSPLGFVIVDAAGRVAELNGTCLRFFGVERGAAVGAELRALLAPFAVQRDVPAAAELADYGPPGEPGVALLCVRATAAGDERWLEHRSQRIDSGPFRGGTLEYFLDVSARRRAEVELDVVRQRYADTVTAGNVGVWDLDLATTTLFVDPGLKRLLGYGPGELADEISTWLDIVHEDDRAKLSAATEPVLQGLAPGFEVEHRLRHRDGSVRWFLARSRALRDAEGSLTRLLGTNTEITAHKAAQEALERSRARLESRVLERTVELVHANRRLRKQIEERELAEAAQRESEARFHEIAETIEDLFWISDLVAGKLLYLSPSCEPLLGLSREAAYRNPATFFSFVHPEDLDRVHAELARTRQGVAVSFEFRAITARGATRYFWTRIRPHIEADGSVKRAAGISTDVTERTVAQLALRDSEARWRSLFEQTTDVVAWISPEGRILVVNRPMPGLSFEQVVGARFADFFQPPQRSDVHEALRRAVHEGVGCRLRLEGITLDGESRWWWTSFAPAGALGQVGGVIAVSRDITEDTRAEQDRRLAEEARLEAESYARHAIDALGSRIAILDGEGRLVVANQAWREFNREMLTGRNDLAPWSASYLEIAEFFAARGHQVAGAIAGAIRTLLRDPSQSFEIEYPVPQGPTSKRWYHVRVRRFLGGGPTRMVVSHEDVTLLRRAMDEMRRSERLVSIGTFAAGIAHEISNPVAGILATGQLLLETAALEDADRGLLARVCDEAQRCGRIVKSVLQFAREESGERWPCDLRDVVWRAGDHQRQIPSQRDVEVELDVGGEPLEIHANPTELEQAVINLLRNAVEAGSRRVTVRTWREPGVAKLAVCDDGPGIPEEQLPMIFDPFHTGRSEKGGTGLGLSIVHGIVTAHGGSIRVALNPAGGTTFSIDLPLHEAQPGEARVAD